MSRKNVLYPAAMRRSSRHWPILGLLVLVAGSTLACRARPAPKDDAEAGAQPKPRELPPLSVKNDTPNLLLTWIDEQGDFHVVDKPTDVPAPARKSVRVVLTDKEAGTGEQVYVADLSEAAADGSYRARTLTRAAWDELGASRRKARLEALAPSSATPPAPSASAAAQGALVVVIYGASWCKPCHDAENYLRSKGIQVVKKDIEENEAAAREMKQKLDRAGMGGASIPVIDVMGRLLVGFSSSALDRALEAARGTQL